jgi:hypothetical protein
MKVTRYKTEVATIPMPNGPTGGGRAAYEESFFRIKGNCAQTLLSYVWFDDEENFTFEGDLTINLVKDESTDPNQVPADHRTGWTIRKHEEHHANIDKTVFNIAADIVNSLEGTYCRPCCSLAKDVGLKFMKWSEKFASLENAKFDNFDYGKRIPQSRVDALAAAKADLDTATDAYDKAGCKKQ